jgi:hypothetical protein
MHKNERDDDCKKEVNKKNFGEKNSKKVNNFLLKFNSINLIYLN